MMSLKLANTLFQIHCRFHFQEYFIISIQFDSKYANPNIGKYLRRVLFGRSLN